MAHLNKVVATQPDLVFFRKKSSKTG